MYLGVEKTMKAMKDAGYKVAAWVDEMLAAGNKSFYKIENGKKLYYDQNSKTYKPLPGGDAFIVMSNYQDKQIWKNGKLQIV